MRTFVKVRLISSYLLPLSYTVSQKKTTLSSLHIRQISTDLWQAVFDICNKAIIK